MAPAPTTGGRSAEEHERSQWVVLLFLEADRAGTDFSVGERALDTLVQVMQPSPSITHVEMFVPATDESAADQHFSTYLGATGATWTTGYGDGLHFYLDPKGNGGSWRAVPVLATDAAARVRSECNLHVDTPYPSFSRLLNYPFSVPPLRAFAGYLDNRCGAAAHCAALSARILQTCMPEMNVPNSSPWYGPSTLYLELARQGRMVAYAAKARAEATVESIVDTEDAVASLDVLLRGNDDEVRALSERSAAAGANLACQHCVAAGVDGDPALIRTRQKEFARAVLRDSWIGRPTRLARIVANNEPPTLQRLSPAVA